MLQKFYHQRLSIYYNLSTIEIDYVFFIFFHHILVSKQKQEVTYYGSSTTSKYTKLKKVVLLGIKQFSGLHDDLKII